MVDEIITPEAEKTEKTEKKTVTKKARHSKSRGKAKEQRKVPRGRAYISASYNNTLITLTDLNGEVIAWSSAGHKGFSGPKKATPYASAQIVRDVADKAKPYELKEVFVFVKGIGSGRESAIRTLNAVGFQILGIKDVTPIPHNGPRAPGPRRV